MPKFIPVNVADVTVPIRHAGLGRAAAITFGVNTDAGDSGLYVAEAIQQAVATALHGLCDSETTIGPTLIRRNEGGTGEPIVYLSSTTASGGRTGESQAPNVALLVRKLTPRGGRSGRGRLFIPWGLAESEVNDVGVLTSAAVTKVNTAMATLLTDLESDRVPMVLLHNTDNPVSTTPNSVTSLVCDNRVATQRRRIGR